MEHRASERGFYDRLQQPGHAEARDLLERLLAEPTRTYEEICRACKSSGLFEDLKDVTPQDLSRYRQRQERERTRANVAALIERDSDTLIAAAAKNPSGPIARYLRRQMTEHLIERLDEQIEAIDPVAISRETARHALVEQRDRKLDIEAEKAALERRRIELAERQAELHRDRYKFAADVWAFTLGWFNSNSIPGANLLTGFSARLLKDMEEWLENVG